MILRLLCQFFPSRISSSGSPRNNLTFLFPNCYRFGTVCKKLPDPTFLLFEVTTDRSFSLCRDRIQIYARAGYTKRASLAETVETVTIDTRFHPTHELRFNFFHRKQYSRSAAVSRFSQDNPWYICCSKCVVFLVAYKGIASTGRRPVTLDLFRQRGFGWPG